MHILCSAYTLYSVQCSTVLVKLRPHTENLYPVRLHTKGKLVLEPITMWKTLLKIKIIEY